MKWALVNNKRQWKPGFTIVELLIVVVVIAILASITIVAYNGVTGRAKSSAAQSAAETASKKVLVYMTTNADQAPPDLATAGITNSGSTTYQYSSNSSVTPQTFCITATTSNVSYYIDNTTHTSPTAGGCPGHAQNGGVVVTNLAWDPAATKFHTTEAGPGWWNNRWGTYGTYSLLTGQAGPVAGLTTAVRWTATAAGAGHGFHLSGNVETATPSDWSGMLPVTPGDMITISAYMRKSGAVTGVALRVRFATDSATWTSGAVGGATVSTITDQWVRVTLTTTVPAGAVRMASLVTDGNDAIGDTLDGTGLMVTQGSTVYSYADPTMSASWIWNGTPNASTSTGPAQ